MNREDNIPRRARDRSVRNITLHIGDLLASKEPARIKTILGSCIAACLYDPTTGIGGMNHFLLPGDTDDPELSTRYGVNAMEVLINEMMKLGARRSSIQAKVFGGGDIFRSNHPYMMVGAKNIRFVLGFLETEGIPIVTSRVGGKQGMMVIYLPHVFEVYVKSLTTERFNTTEEKEFTYRRKLTQELTVPHSENVTLF